MCIYLFGAIIYIYVYHTPPAHTTATHTATHHHTPAAHTPAHATTHQTPPPAYTPARTTGGEGVWHSARRAISRERGLSRFEGRNANPLIIRYNTDFRGTRQYKGYVSQTLNNQRVIGEYK